MSFYSDMKAIVDGFYTVSDTLQVSINDYKEYFENEKTNYRDSTLLKEKMLETLNKAVFTSELAADNNKGMVIVDEDVYDDGSETESIYGDETDDDTSSTTPESDGDSNE